MKNIYPIILGNNNNNLYGSVNDSLLFYNIFYKFYNKYNNWKKPFLLTNKDVSKQNLLHIIKKIDRMDKELKNIVIYFSGHSLKNGKLQFYNEYVSNQILNQINSNIKFKINIYFIIDSCFSSNFIKNKLNILINIKKISYLVSCDNKQTSKEIIIDNNKDFFKYKKNINYKKNKIIVGIFSFYLYKLILFKNINNLNDWKKIINFNIWKMIEKNYGQTIYYFENNFLL